MKTRLISLILVLTFVGASLAQQQTFGNATFVRDVDPFTDKDKSRVIILANERGSFGGRGALVWRCATTGYELFISVDEYLDSRSVRVRHRFDDRPVSSVETWSASTTGTAAFAREQQRSLFTSGALQARRVLIGVQDFRGQEYAYTFELTGLVRAIEALPCLSVADQAVVVTVQSLPAAYQGIKQVLDGEDYTEGNNVIYAEELVIRFFPETGGMARISLQGGNTALRDRIIQRIDGL